MTKVLNLEQMLDAEIKKGMAAITLALSLSSAILAVAWHASSIGYNLKNIQSFLKITVTNSQAYEDPMLIQRSVEDFWKSTQDNSIFSSLMVSIEGRPVAEVGNTQEKDFTFSLTDNFSGIGERIISIKLDVNYAKIAMRILSMFLFLFIVSAVIYNLRKNKVSRLVRKIIEPLGLQIEQLLLVSKLSNFDEMNKKNERQPYIIAEFEKLATAYDQVIESFSTYSDLKKTSALVMLAEQVAHDIRSPVAALNLVLKNSTELPESKRNLAKAAIERIAFISNSLLNETKKNHVTHAQQKTQQQNVLIRPLYKILSEIVEEKLVQFSELKSVHIGVRFNERDKNLSVAMNAYNLKGILSNCINNCIDARNSRVTPLAIIVILRRLSSKHVEIRIDDNAGTIPPELLAEFNTGKFRSFGKEKSKTSGSGIGLSSSHVLISNHGGSISFYAIEPIGTSVRINLPLE